MGIQFVERHIATVEELQTGMRALRRGEVDAFFSVSDAIINNQAQLIIDMARIKQLPTIWDLQSNAIKGGLASYAVSYHEVGRLSAKYVQRILAGLRPNDMPVEGVDKIELIINVKAARQIGLTIPPNVLARADKVIKEAPG
jgi:putative ABC transport system substrate-binding protein